MSRLGSHWSRDSKCSLWHKGRWLKMTPMFGEFCMPWAGSLWHKRAGVRNSSDLQTCPRPSGPVCFISASQSLDPVTVNGSRKCWGFQLITADTLEIELIILNYILQIIDDDSGLGGFGADIDFTNNKLIKDRVNVLCMNQCFEWKIFPMFWCFFTTN